jgi:AraC-like DNA-binding protein
MKENYGDTYGFSNHDTFTRAFKRITGLTPSEFKKKRPSVGRIKLCAGVYGIGLLNQVKRKYV